MESGHWFFALFGGGWRFAPSGDNTQAVGKYNFSVRPQLLQPIAHPLGRWLLGRDIRRRIEAFAKARQDPVVLRAVSGSS